MNIFRSRQLIACFLSALAFVPLYATLPTTYLFDVVNALTVSVGIGVLFAYFPGVVRSFRSPIWRGAHYLVLGIAVTWFATTTRHLWNWLWRFYGKPDSMIDHALVAFMVWLAMIGGVLHLAAKGAIDGEIPRENWLRLGIAIAFGLGLAGLVIMFIEAAPPP